MIGTRCEKLAAVYEDVCFPDYVVIVDKKTLEEEGIKELDAIHMVF